MLSDVSAVVPHFECHDHLHAALDSLYRQTVRPDRVYVISDGDEEPPWEVCRGFPLDWLRLVYMNRSMGPFLAIDLAFRASSSTYILVQDADDTSDTRRVEMLLDELSIRSDFIAAASSQIIHTSEGVLYESLADRFNKPIASAMTFDRFRHHALYRRRSMLKIGGYYGGFRFGYDAYLTGLIHRIGAVRYIDAPLYHRHARQNSLTASPATGHDSPERRLIRRHLMNLMDRVIESAPFSVVNRSRLAEISRYYISMEREREIALLAEQLRGLRAGDVLMGFIDPENDTHLAAFDAP